MMLLQVIATTVAATLLANTPIGRKDVDGPVAWGSTQATRIGNLWFAGQPDREGFEAAKAAGVGVVVNMREASETTWDESATVEELGMRYYRVPVAGGRPFQPDAFDRIESIVAEHAGEPILVHCASGNRTGGWFATHLARKGGKNVDDAIDLVTEAGISRPEIAGPVRAFMRAEQAARRADGAAQALKQRLTSELNAALERGGASEGVRACSEIAEQITAEAGAERGLVVRRTALKARNPANAPDEFEREWMERAEKQVREGRTPAATRAVVGSGPQAQLRALYPIVFPGGVCSRCHGETSEIDAEVRALIEERYPQDRATGFRPGDFRGAVSVRVPLAPADPGSEGEG